MRHSSPTGSRLPPAAGLAGIMVLWGGQTLSLVGTAMTQLGITVWVWEQTGEATALALVAASTFGSTVLLTPVAGALVDRWSRKAAMAAADAGAAAATASVLALAAAGRLEVWHLYLAGAISGSFQALQFPAYSAAITVMVPKDHYARASGLFTMAQSGSGILGPLLAGSLLALLGLEGILAVDLATFLVAVGALVWVRVPSPVTSGEGQAGLGSLPRETAYGFRYILERRELLALQLVFFGVNLILAFCILMLPALVLARSGGDEVVLGVVRAAAGLGGVAGGLLLSVWGGPSRRIDGVLLGMMVAGVFVGVIAGAARGVAGWVVGSFLGTAAAPVINGCNQAIWQAKVPPDLQGRVFAARRVIAQSSVPVALLAGGPLADHWLEPMMREGSAGGFLAPLLGSGPGAGIGLLFALGGVLALAIGGAGYLLPVVREVEERLPDHGSAG